MKPRPRVVSQDTLPCSTEAEEGVVSAILQTPALLTEIISSLPAENLYNGPLRTIYETMMEMSHDETPVDLITLVTRLTDTGKMDAVGGPGRLAEIYSLAPIQCQYEFYIETIKEKALLRTVIEQCSTIRASAFNMQGDLNEFREAAAKAVAEMNMKLLPEEKEADLAGHLEQWGEDWEQIRKGNKESAMPLRWPRWNDYITGLRPGYSVFSGLRGGGKSTFVQNIFTDACFKRQRPGLYASYEMPVRMVLSRMIAETADVDGDFVFSPDIRPPSEDTVRKIAAARARIMSYSGKVHIIHKATMQLGELAHRARVLHSRYGDLVMVCDYSAIAPVPHGLEKGANREREVAAGSSILRSLSKELNCPVINLSQVNKDGATRESMALENDADDLYRIQPDGIFVSKNRNGKVGDVLPLVLKGSRFRFVESESPPPAKPSAPKGRYKANHIPD